MKKLICILIMLLLIASFLVFPVCASETEEYSVEITLVTKGSDKEGFPFIAYFRNNQTGEVIGFYLDQAGYNSFPVADLPAGEYTFERFVLATQKNMVYSAANEVETLVIAEDDYTFCTLKVSATGTDMGTNMDSAYATAPVYRPVVDHSNDPESRPMFWILLGGVFLPVTLTLVLWMINSIRARRNLYRRFVAKFYKHLCIAIFSFMLGTAFSGGSSIPPVLVIAFCTGFPFGFIALATFRASYDYLPTAEEFEEHLMARDLRTDDQNAMEDTAMGCGFLFLAFLCGLIGVVALPMTLIKDVKNIKKFKYLDRKI